MFKISFKRDKAPVKTPLESLQDRSANAVSFLRTTIEELKATNAEIDAEHANNNSAIAKLTATNESLDTLKLENIKVIASFEGLLS